MDNIVAWREVVPRMLNLRKLNGLPKTRTPESPCRGLPHGSKINTLLEPMSFSWTRVGAILRKELRDYRRNRFVIGTMAAVPVLFIILPMIQLIAANATGKNLSVHVGLSLLYMLVIPVMVPSVVSAYSVVGEREQGTLEPVLITPIRREEFLIGKALAAFVPTLLIAYTVFGIFLGAAALVAHPAIASAIYTGPHVLVQLLFTPLLAGWAIWVGIAVSARSTDVRAAQQVAVLGSVPPLVVLALLSLNVITESTALALGLAAALLAFDLLAWRLVAAMFDRERLVTGRRGEPAPTGGRLSPEHSERRPFRTGGDQQWRQR
ncbi:MAG: ABC transporter permease [Solirubrobacteraceae bacterium]